MRWAIPARPRIDVERLDFARLSRLDFEAPDEERFPALRLARTALERGGQQGAVLNAAEETALDAFIEGRIGFLEMAEIVEGVMDDDARSRRGERHGRRLRHRRRGAPACRRRHRQEERERLNSGRIRRPYATARARAHCDQRSCSAPTRWSMSSSECSGDGVIRSRSVFFGTVG